MVRFLRHLEFYLSRMLTMNARLPSSPTPRLSAVAVSFFDIICANKHRRPQLSHQLLDYLIPLLATLSFAYTDRTIEHHPSSLWSNQYPPLSQLFSIFHVIYPNNDIRNLMYDYDIKPVDSCPVRRV